MADNGITQDIKTKIFIVINYLENSFKSSEKWTKEYDVKVKHMRRLINNFDILKPKITNNNSKIQQFIGI